MNNLMACFAAIIMVCGSAFAGLESDKAGSGLKFRESAGSSRFSSRSGGGSGGVYIGGGSSSRSKSAKRFSAAEISRSRTGSKKLAMEVPAPAKTQQASASPASNESGGKSSIFSKAGAAVRNLASKAAKAATSPTGKKVLLGAALLAAAAVGGHGVVKLQGKLAAGAAAQKQLAAATKQLSDMKLDSAIAKTNSEMNLREVSMLAHKSIGLAKDMSRRFGPEVQASTKKSAELINRTISRWYTPTP
ncbi:MAG: hypothetical protein WC421_03145 [Elusimicrobiales bacterium]